MKKTIILALFCANLLAFNAEAKVHTVSNYTNSPGQFTNVQAAHDAAADGDTLYIHASPTSYGDLTILKKLTLIGEGALPDKQVQFSTQMDKITLSYAPFPATTTASGSKIFGLDIVSSITLGYTSSSNTSSISSVTISRNRFERIITNQTSINNIVKNNIGNHIYGNMKNTLISNNIVQTVNMWSVGGNNVITNNIIQSSILGDGDIVSNNIFYNYASSGSIDISTNIKSTVFNNNLFYSYTPVTIDKFIYGSNTGTGNLLQQDPKFTTPALVSNLFKYNGYSYTFPAAGPFANFHLESSSPGKNYGTDGTDIGIYGGPNPWVDGSTTDSRFRYFAMPNNVPHMKSMDILNTVQPVNGTLNVKINAEIQN